MKSNREHTTEEVEKALFKDVSLTLGDYFLLAGAVMYWQMGGPFDGYPMITIIEIDELAAACKQYLRDHSAPEYSSLDEAKAARTAH